MSKRVPRLPIALAAGAAAFATAAPAMASEDPVNAAPPPSWALPPVTALPVPLPHVLTPRSGRPVIRRARLVPRHIRSGRRATLRLSLSAPGRLVIAITRVSRPHRGAVAVRRVAAAGRKLSLRLPKRFHGHKLATGRYRITVVAVDASGSRSRPVHRSLVVRAARG